MGVNLSPGNTHSRPPPVAEGGSSSNRSPLAGWSFKMRVALLAAALLVVLAWFSACVGGRSVSSPKKEAKIERQLKRLKKMACQPVLKKVYVLQELAEYNELIDKRLLTNVVAIRRCDDSCSYCGTDKGLEVKRCQKAKWRRKRFHVIYFDDNGRRHHSHFRAEEHTQCECKILNNDISEGWPKDVASSGKR